MLFWSKAFNTLFCMWFMHNKSHVHFKNRTIYLEDAACKNGQGTLWLNLQIWQKGSLQLAQAWLLMFQLSWFIFLKPASTVKPQENPCSCCSFAPLKLKKGLKWRVCSHRGCREGGNICNLWKEEPLVGMMWSRNMGLAGRKSLVPLLAICSAFSQFRFQTLVLELC